MRKTTVIAALALAAAIIAAVAAVYAPHQATEGAQSGPGQRVVTAGIEGSYSPEEVAAIINSSRILPSTNVGGVGALTTASGPVYGVGPLLEEQQSPRGAPEPNEGDIMKVSPPYGIYIKGTALYLLRLWPPDDMEVIDEVDLPDIVRKALVALGKIPEWAPIYVTQAEALISGDSVVVAATYFAMSGPTSLECFKPETYSVDVAGEDVTIALPGCRVMSTNYGTAIAIIGFSDKGLHVKVTHIVEGLSLYKLRLEEGIAYAFLRPTQLEPTGKEFVDGVPLLQAGPSYVIETSPYGNSFITIVAVSPSTGEVGVTNLVLPASEVAANPVIYVRGHEAYLLTMEGLGISDEELAEGMIACAEKAPDGLREVLRSLGPDPSPTEVLEAVKKWADGVQEDVLPLVKWAEALAGGDLVTGSITKLMKERPPTTYIDAVDEAVGAIKEMDSLITCAGERAGRVIARTTRAVKMVFEGLAGSVAAVRTIPGYVASESLVYGDGDNLYVVTTEVKGRLHFIPLPTTIMFPRIPVGVDEAHALEEARKWSAIWTAENILLILESVEHADNLTDIVRAEPAPGATKYHTLHVLSTENLGDVAGIGNIAPGKEVVRLVPADTHLYLIASDVIPSILIIDVTDPADPTLTREWVPPLYIDYLSPWGTRYFIGVGTENYTLVVELYDASDPGNIVRVGNATALHLYPYSLGEYTVIPINNDTFAIPVNALGKGNGLAVSWVSPWEGMRYLGFVKVKEPIRVAGIDSVLYAFDAESVIAVELPGLRTASAITLP